MLTITNISKLLIIAFSITCSIILFWQYGSPIFSHVSDEIADVRLETKTLPLQNSLIPVVMLNNITNDLKITRIDHAFTSKSLTPEPTSTPNAQNSIWVTIGQQLKLDHSAQNPRVKKEIRKILANKQDFQAILNRSTPYIYYIYSQTQKRHLPAELALIPIIESEYNPNDHNSIDALGLWQLMPGTAKILGVKMGNGYDGRRNVEASTKAALTFFTDLKNQFNGNWNLAFAAYNCGPGCVSSAVKRSNSNNYFNLSLPLETKIYVPRLLAMAEIIKHAKEYGITLPPIPDAPYFTKVQVKKSQTLANFAKSTGSDLTELKKLNPDYRFKKTLALNNSILVPLK